MSSPQARSHGSRWTQTRWSWGDAAGARQRTLVAAGDVEDLGQPVFSADGGEVWFVSLEAEPAVPEASGWRWPSLISTARAHDSHDLPGDWWAADVAG